MCPPEDPAAVVAQGYDLGPDAGPAEVAFEGTGDVGLAAGGQTDGEDENLSGMEEQP